MKAMMRSRRLALLAATLGVSLLGLALCDLTVDAQRGRLRARVFMTQHRIPRNLTERGLINFVRRHNARSLRETTHEELNDREWRAEMVTSFNRAPGDLEFQVLFYDIEDGGRRFVEPPLSTFISNREEKTFLQRLRLPRPEFRPNRRMELVVVVRRQEVGRQRFQLAGEERRHTGEVSFSDSDS